MGMEEFKEKAKKATDKAKELGEKAAEKTKEAAADPKGTAVAAGEKAKEVGGKAVEKTKEAGEAVKEKVKGEGSKHDESADHDKMAESSKENASADGQKESGDYKQPKEVTESIKSDMKENKEKMPDEHKTNKAAAGAAVAGAAAVGAAAAAGKNDSMNDTKVHFEEGKNEEKPVAKDANKSLPSPTEEDIINKQRSVNKEIKEDRSRGMEERGNAHKSKHELDSVTGAVSLDELKEGTQLYDLKKDDQIVCEGYVKKRMFFCRCFWHSRYFVLTKSGEFMYFRSLSGKSSGLINVPAEVKEIMRVDDTQLQKITLRYTDDAVESFQFHDNEARNVWNDKLRGFIHHE